MRKGRGCPHAISTQVFMTIHDNHHWGLYKRLACQKCKVTTIVILNLMNPNLLPQWEGKVTFVLQDEYVTSF